MNLLKISQVRKILAVLIPTLLILVFLCSCTSLGNKSQIEGELKKWHKVTLKLQGPEAHERDSFPNPFLHYEMNVFFEHESGTPGYKVPGYFAADGNASETSAESGNIWKAHLSPDKTGNWNYRIEFLSEGEETRWNGIKGSFVIGETDKSGRDFRGKGRLLYVRQRYLQFAETGEYFLKAGADAPETLLAYADFDGTYSVTELIDEGKSLENTDKLKTWEAHLTDWQDGDPEWQNGKGKGLIGAVNYLSSTGCNAFSFLTYNAGGDGYNVWPHVSHTDKLHFDCSKLDQWGIVFDHATSKGMYLHFKLQETENDDINLRHSRKRLIEQSLDEGNLGLQRKLYLRELIARYGHNLALNWNLGEENTQTTEQILDMAKYIRETDPYNHHIVLHTFPDEQMKVYGPLLGNKEALSGVSIQNSDVADTHSEAVKWVNESEKSGHPWVVAHDESGNAQAGTPPDPDYPGMSSSLQKISEESPNLKVPTIDEIRSEVLWGNLLGGGAGVEYYFGYRLPQNDLNAEDWRSRAKTWKYSSIALGFFHENAIPFYEMSNTDELVFNPGHSNSAYCFSKKAEIYLVYFPSGNPPDLDLSQVSGNFSVKWFNPRTGGELKTTSLNQVAGGGIVKLGNPPEKDGKDWLVLLRKL